MSPSSVLFKKVLEEYIKKAEKEGWERNATRSEAHLEGSIDKYKFKKFDVRRMLD
jgi:hypothetical protein